MTVCYFHLECYNFYFVFSYTDDNMAKSGFYAQENILKYKIGYIFIFCIQVSGALYRRIVYNNVSISIHAELT